MGWTRCKELNYIYYSLRWTECSELCPEHFPTVYCRNSIPWFKIENTGFMFPSVRRRCSRPASATYKFSEEGKSWNGVSQEQQVQTAFNVLILEFGGAMAVAWRLLALAHSTLNPNRQEGAHDLPHKQHTTLSQHNPHRLQPFESYMKTQILWSLFGRRLDGMTHRLIFGTDSSNGRRLKNIRK